MASRMRRTLIGALVAVAVAIPFVVAPSAHAAKYRYGIVVMDSAEDPSPSVECVKLSADKIRAFDLLSRSRFPIYSNVDPAFGRELCWIDGTGYLPADHEAFSSCFRDTSGGFRDTFWNISTHRGAGDVESSAVGLSGLMLQRNTVVYLQFAAWKETSPGNFEPPPAPPKRPLSSICSPG